MTEQKQIINDRIIRLTGSASISEELEMGTDYQVLAETSLTSITESDNQDGTKSLTYRLRLAGQIQINRIGKTPIKGKVKGNSPS